MLVYIQVDALQVYAQCGNGTEVSHTADVDTGGTITMLLTFEDFPNITVQSPTARSSRRGSSARASSHIQQRRVSGAGRMLLKRHLLATTPVAAPSSGAVQRATPVSGGTGATAELGAASTDRVDEWSPRRDELGRVYYHNYGTRETRWSLPAGATVGASPDDALPGDWQERTDRHGRVYYFSPSSGESQWLPPTASDVASGAGGAVAGAATGVATASTGASARSHRRRGSVAAAAKAAARRRKESRASVLPGDWVAATDSAGRVYYTSAAHNTSQWERPTVA